MVTSTSDLRILVVAEDVLARAGLASLISGIPGCIIAGQTAGDEKLREEGELYRPDILVWDLGVDPTEPLKRLRDLGTSSIPIIALVSDQEGADEASIYGIRGILARDVQSRALLMAIRSVAEGLTVIDSRFADALLSGKKTIPEPLPELLTSRESEVLQLLALGLPNKSIASRLGISEHTVKFHVNSILSKLSAQSRTEAVSRGTRLGLIKL